MHQHQVWDNATHLRDLLIITLDDQ